MTGVTSELAAEAHPTGDGGVRAIAATRFGSYTLVAKLGQGAMAEVYLALRSGQGGFRKLVVIKKLHPHLLEESGVRDMFMDEARLAALLGHANVVTTNEVGEIDGLPFMAIEYLDGQPISQILARCQDLGAPLPPHLLARIMSDALDGLQHAHDLTDLHGEPLRVVHRDISPHNLFVTYAGVTKVLDFGVAKAALQVAHTEIGAIKGKYAYLSPEQAEQGELDARSDVWGVGVVLWECLTGRRLFKRDTEMATLKAVTEGEIPPVLEVAIDAPKELAAIAARALTRDRDQRYPSAHAMREDLDEYLRTLPEPVRHRDVGAQLRQLFVAEIEERRAAVSACVRGEVGDLTGTVGIGETTSPSYSQRGQAKTPGSRRWMAALLPLGIVLGAAAALAIAWPMLSDRFVEDDAPAASAQPGLAPPSEAPAPAAAEEEVRAAVVLEAAEAPRVPEGGATREEPSSEPRQGRRGPRRGSERRSATEEAAAAPTGGTGTLYLDTTPWASVSLGARSLGDTPLMGVELPAGRHVLTLRNAEQGIEQRYTVTIEAGQATRRRIGLR